MAGKNHTDYYKKLLLDFIAEPDPLFSMLQWLTHRMMELESEAKAGAPKGKHSSERKTHFSGTRVRRFDTRLGTMYLLVPKLRQGGYIPFFVTERKRSEQALIQVVQEAFINGVSTRKIERLAKSMGIEGISAGQVSEITKSSMSRCGSFKPSPWRRDLSRYLGGCLIREDPLRRPGSDNGCFGGRWGHPGGHPGHPHGGADAQGVGRDL